MARPLRIELAGALYHVTSRGNERCPIVRDDADRHKRLEWLRRTVETYGWRLHAFVLMTNHEHLFLQTPEPNLSAGMQLLNGSYTGYFNRRHHRFGHLFQGRFKGQLVEQEGYYLELSRYIHLNPVRAGIVRKPQQWPWSSYPGYHWGSRRLPWVDCEPVLTESARDEQQARRAYRQFVAAGLDQPLRAPWADAVAGLLIGSQAFVERMRKRLGDLPQQPGVPQRKRLLPRPSLEEIAALVLGHFGGDRAAWSAGRRSDDASRAVAAFLARQRFGYPATEVARALGYRGPSSVSRAAVRVEQGNQDLKQTAALLEGKLNRGSELE